MKSIEGKLTLFIKNLEGQLSFLREIEGLIEDFKVISESIKPLFELYNSTVESEKVRPEP